jgi:hypothetical protein
VNNADSTSRVTGRALLALLGFAAVNVWVGAVLQGAQETGNPLYGVFTGFLTLLLYGVIGIPLVALILLPGAVATRAVLHRLDSHTRRAQLWVGGATWATWGLVLGFAAQATPVETRPPVASVIVAALVAAMQGALFALVALKPPWSGSSKAAVYAAVAVVLFVVGGALITALRGVVLAG